MLTASLRDAAALCIVVKCWLVTMQIAVDVFSTYYVEYPQLAVRQFMWVCYLCMPAAFNEVITVCINVKRDKKSVSLLVVVAHVL